MTQALKFSTSSEVERTLHLAEIIKEVQQPGPTFSEMESSRAGLSTLQTGAKPRREGTEGMPMTMTIGETEKVHMEME